MSTDHRSQSPDDTSATGLGLWLDALGAHGAEAAREEDGSQASSGSDAWAIPPAVLLPRFRKEPLACDLTWPPHPRGCGDIWPPEARVEPPDLPGRLPISYAWPMLRTGATWRWTGFGRPAQLSAASAIGETARVAVELLGWDTNTPLGLVVSDALEPTGREHLRAALATSLPAAALIDASAAALAGAAASGHGPAPGSPQAGEAQPDPTPVLHLHMGFDRWYAQALEVTPSDSPTRITARTWVMEPVPGIGIGLLHTLAERAIAMSYKRTAPGSLWQLIWTTPWARDVLASLAGRTHEVPGQRYGLSPHVCRQHFLIQHARLPVQQALQAYSAAIVPYSHMLGEAPDQSQLQDQLQLGQRRLASAGKARPSHAIVTGELACLPDDHGSATLAEQYVRALQPRIQTIAVQGRNLSNDVLARGAARVMTHQSSHSVAS